MLLLAHTDVDKTNKSYYGETNLMLLSAAGNFDCRVSLGEYPYYLWDVGYWYWCGYW